jgi:hypothetical protein
MNCNDTDFMSVTFVVSKDPDYQSDFARWLKEKEMRD